MMKCASIVISIYCGLMPGIGMTVTTTPSIPETVAPTWVVDPSVPGDTLPPVGQSLFDRLFAAPIRPGLDGRTSEHDIPYPFNQLLAHLDAQLARDPHGQLPPAKRVLIPLGRSLQRTAAAPDYFAFPRVVVAADASPAHPGALFLKDRLYIGYQEKSDVLEVISYNEAAGRFEFQLVRNYRAGAKPQVIYANRTLCFACHQNGAPIFSRALWDETNANHKIAEQLAATGKNFYGIPLTRGVDVPYAIDIGIRRANDFALIQRLWREGCGEDDLPARRCRSSLFKAALRHALADGRLGYHDPEFDEMVATPLLARAAQLWPGGLVVTSSDLPNRNPLQAADQWPEDKARRAHFTHVAAAFDPLLPRTAGDIWQANGKDVSQPLGRLIGGLAGFIADTDRQLLVATLARQSTTTRTWRAPCRFDIRASRWSVRCLPLPGETGVVLQATLSIESGELTGGRVERLMLPASDGINGIALTRGPNRSGEYRVLVPVDGQNPRSADGNPLARVAFRFSNDADPSSISTAAGEVMVDIRQEFPAIERALSALLEGKQSKALFGARPFPREAIFYALLTELGAAHPPPCCETSNHLPAPQSDATIQPSASPTAKAGATAHSVAQEFIPYCATCHQSNDHFPPNFLSGSDDEVTVRLRQCAPRIFVRLSMPDLSPEQRDKTPMPPESLLPVFGTDPPGWRASPVRAALLARVGDWLRAETGQPANLQQLLAAGYEALRPCLPDH